MIFLICISFVQANFNTQYVTEQLEIQLSSLNSSKTYLLKMIITEFPANNYCLPLLQVIINNQEYNDTLSYSTKANIHKVYFNSTESITIKVSCNFIEYFQNQNNIDKTMHFNLSLNEAIYHQSSPCQIPHYGQNCSLSIQQIQKEFSVTILILNNTWFYAYTILDQEDYQIIIQNRESLFGISIISLDKINSTSLPSFLSNFFVLHSDKDDYNIFLPKNQDNLDGIYIIGLYNFNSTSISEITITITAGVKIEEFPFWAIILLISIILFGIILFLIILYFYRRQYKKITQIIPALDRKVLKKYMPTLKIDKKMISETCSVCLKNIVKLLANIIFMNNAYWIGQLNKQICPVCRQGLLEKEIIELLEVKTKRNRQIQELNMQEIIKSKDDPPSQTYRDLPFLQLSSTPFRSSCKIELDGSPQEQSPQIIQFDGSPQNLTNRNLCFQSDVIIEKQI